MKRLGLGMLAIALAMPVYADVIIRNALSSAMANTLYLKLDASNGPLTGKLRTINGTAATPAVDSAAGAGFHFTATAFGIDVGGVTTTICGVGCAMGSSGTISWSSNNDATATADLKLLRVAANQLGWAGSGVAAVTHNYSGLTGTRIVTWPDAATSMPVFGQTITFAGPTVPRTITLPDAAITVARTDAGQTFTGTQVFGAVTATTINGNTITTGTGTLTIATGKTLTANNTLTLAGTDSTTMTFPTTTATIARTDAAQSFTGLQTVTGGLNLTDNDLELNAYKYQSFVIQITNTAAVIQHRISQNYATLASSLGPYSGKVTGASITLANTPALAAGVGFTSGFGYDATATSIGVFNTPNDQVDAVHVAGSATVVYNDTGTTVFCDVLANSVNAGGTTKFWPGFRCITAAGTSFGLDSTTNIPANKSLIIKLNVYIK